MTTNPSKHKVSDRAAARRGKPALWRLSAWLGAAVIAVLFACAVLSFELTGPLLNRYGKARAERAFAHAHPGCALRIGRLDYTLAANRLVAQSLALSGTNIMLRAGKVSLTGVRWARLLWGRKGLADIFVGASLDATNLAMELPRSHYLLRCARLRASGPESELFAEGTELRPLAGDEEFFAAHDVRAPRFLIVLPECRVSGLAYGEALQGKAYRAESVRLLRPSLEVLVNRDKPPPPFAKSPLMVHEALASIPLPLRVGRLSVTNGEVKYCERLAIGTAPAVLTVGAISLSIEGIANRGDATSNLELRGEGDLMNAGKMNLLMSIPILSPDFSLHYSGSIGALDLTRLNPFLEIAEHTRIKSGHAQQAEFEIDVAAGQARGRVRATYHDLEIALLDKESGDAQGLANRVASFFVNALRIRNSNSPQDLGPRKEGQVNYTRRPGDQFQQIVWFALRTGVLDIINF